MKCLVVLAVFAALAAFVTTAEDIDILDSGNAHLMTKRDIGCSASGCTTLCQKQGHARGVCIGTYCQCRFRRRRSLLDVIEPNIDTPHVIEKRQIQGPLFPRCVFYECIAQCRQRRFKGGYCTIRGCQCTR